MKYIIQFEDNTYLKSYCCKEKTDSEKLAYKWDKLCKAENVANVINNAKNCVLKCKVIVLEDEITFEEIPEKIQFSDAIDFLTEFKNKCQKRNAYLNQELSKCDKALVDIEHKIEFSTFNAAEGYKLAKRLKDYRVRRRELKDEMEKIKYVSELYNNVSHVQSSIAGMDNKNMKQEY